MPLTEKQKHDLKRFVKELESYSGRHTEFVTVYIPQGYDIIKIIQHLDQEKGTASNIKSAVTRKNVVSALEKMTQHLRLFKQTPPNGLACFTGNVASHEGKEDLRVWSIEPPDPIKTRIYRCDKNFQTDILRNMLDIKEVYGLVVLDRRDAAIALLKGKSIILLKTTHSEVPGKTRAGGQSAARFERLRDGAALEHFKKVAEYVKEQFFHLTDLKGIIVGGPGPTKYEWVDGHHLTDQLQQKIIGIKDLSYTDEFGLQEMVEKSEDLLVNEGIVAEKKIMNRFLELLAKQPNIVSYGEQAVLNYLNMGVVDTLLISDSLDEEKIESMENIAQQFSTNVIIISTETREGAQLKELGKAAAILRFEQHV